MPKVSTRYMEKHHDEAMSDLRAELNEFCYDGLTLLRQHLQEGKVLRGSWAGCVISYKKGAPGSTRRDRQGRARNQFTVLWDNGWLSQDEVLSAVDAELVERKPSRETERAVEAIPV